MKETAKKIIVPVGIIVSLREDDNARECCERTMRENNYARENIARMQEDDVKDSWHRKILVLRADEFNVNVPGWCYCGVEFRVNVPEKYKRIQLAIETLQNVSRHGLRHSQNITSAPDS